MPATVMCRIWQDARVLVASGPAGVYRAMYLATCSDVGLASLCRRMRPEAGPHSRWPSRAHRLLRAAGVALFAAHFAAAVWYCLMVVAWLGLSAVLGAFQAVAIVATIGGRRTGWEELLLWWSAAWVTGTTVYKPGGLVHRAAAAVISTTLGVQIRYLGSEVRLDHESTTCAVRLLSAGSGVSVLAAQLAQLRAQGAAVRERAQQLVEQHTANMRAAAHKLALYERVWTSSKERAAYARTMHAQVQAMLLNVNRYGAARRQGAALGRLEA